MIVLSPSTHLDETRWKLSMGVYVSSSRSHGPSPGCSVSSQRAAGRSERPRTLVNEYEEVGILKLGNIQRPSAPRVSSTIGIGSFSILLHLPPGVIFSWLNIFEGSANRRGSAPVTLV